MNRLLILMIVSAIISSTSYSQKIINKIKKVETLKVYVNGNIEIGKIVINQTLETKIYLISATQTVDSSGIYTTRLVMGNTDRIPAFNVAILLSFDLPIISCASKGRSSEFNVQAGLINNSKQYLYRAGTVNRPMDGNLDELIEFTTYSIFPIFTTIEGIAGKL